MACIYQIRNKINNKIYIGSTQKLNPYRRKGEHFSTLNNNKHRNTHLQKSWNKYGEENFVFEILEELIFSEDYNKNCQYEYIMGREMYYMNLLNADYNIMKETSGGKLGRIPTQKERDYLSKLFSGRIVSEETKEKIRIARAKQIITEEHKRKISEAGKGIQRNLGRKQTSIQKEKNSAKVLEYNKLGIGMHSIESKEKRTITLKKKFNTPELRKILQQSSRNRCRKEFLCYKDNIFVKEFSNQIECAEFLGFKKAWGISSVLNNTQKTHKGYTFKYKEDI